MYAGVAVKNEQFDAKSHAHLNLVESMLAQKLANDSHVVERDCNPKTIDQGK
jgi:hypothetical protein